MTDLANPRPAPLRDLAPLDAVAVRAPGRLHLGFLDPSASLGRAFGGVGLVIEGFETVVEMRGAAADAFVADTADGRAELDRAAAFVHRLRERTGRRQPLALRLRDVLPAHRGFGSGTQLALAVGRAFSAWQSLSVPTATLAQWLGRGLRSGIGIAGFDRGGLIVDGGPGRRGEPAPVLARMDWPAAWRVIVVQDLSRRGLAGADEREAIQRLAPLSRTQAAEVCHEVLMRLLPGVADHDFDAFAGGAQRVQEVLGEHFAPAQSGSAFSSGAVERMLRALGDDGGQRIAIGQSSWGPTGFAFAPSQASAEGLVERARAGGSIGPDLRVAIVGARNRGVDIAPCAALAPAA